VSLKDRAAIVGIGQLPFSKNIGKSEDVTALEAARIALDDAGLRPTDVDGMVKWSIQTTAENVIARNLGVPNLRFFGEVGYGGGGGCGTVAHAAAAIAAGMARCVLIYRSRNRGSGGRPWAGTSRERDLSQAEGNETALYAPYGFVRPVDQVAMFARRFLYDHGYTTTHLGWIAVSTRKHATKKSWARRRGWGRGTSR
jgi:acetyl-CoA acetyltransferase